MHALAKKAEEMGGAFQPVSLDDPRLRQRPYRRPDYFAEWTELKRAWTLRRRGQDVFSRNIIRKATETFYPDQPLQGLADWLYRLASQIMGRAGMESFRFAAARIDEATRKPEFSALVAHYNSQMATKRGRKYLSIVSEYFDSYSEFSQVQFLMAGGVLPDAHFRVTSTDFNKTKMFYGNGFEILADQIDFIALVNNVLSGRKFDRFSELSLKRYYEIDKSGRANCFVADVALATFTAEFDNQIRNASHHGGMEFDAFSQTISYRAGKGGTGPEQQMTYTAYLTKCVEVFSQVLRLLMIELVLTQQVGLDEPL
ncbi:hypothetical protein [Caulobacter segnis]|uniref:hypothetical protein n=1 Tax=Caulobacter segnis TaxID=88688 RepID=UPI002857DD5E|nr:hypothetical protein [Caulobacter segnis]MDR6624730.1 hypothetical protein [Caulobacter segnis]